MILAISMVNSKNKHIENIMFFHGALDTYAFKMGIGLLVSSYEDIIVTKCWISEWRRCKFFWPKLTKKTENAFFTPLPRVVKGWNLYVWQWIFKADLLLTSKNSQLLQNKQFADFQEGGIAKNLSTIFFVDFFFRHRKMKCLESSETCFP